MDQVSDVGSASPPSVPRLDRRRLVVLLLVFVVAFGVRAAATVSITSDASAPWRTLDSPSYLGPARALVRSGRLDLSPDLAEPSFIRTPGYPIMIAAVFTAFGDDGETPLLLVQGAIGAATAVMAALLAWRLGPFRAGALAGAVCAVDPQQVALSGVVMAEVLFTALLTAATLAAVAAAQATGRRARGGAGAAALVLLLGATYVRPSTLYFPVVLLVVALGAAAIGPVRRRLALDRRSLLPLAVGVAVFLVGVAPWYLRNQQQVGSLRFSGIESIDLYYYRAAAAQARATGTPLAEVRKELAEAAVGRPLGKEDALNVPLGALPGDLPSRQGPYLVDINRRAVEKIRTHPVEVVVGTLSGVPVILVGPGKAETFDLMLGSSPGVLAAAYAVVVALVLVLAVVALVGLLRRPRSDGDPAPAPAAIAVSRVLAGWVVLAGYLVLSSAGPQAEGRFRAPLMPVVFSLAAVGAVAVVDRVRARRSAGEG